MSSAGRRRVVVTGVGAWSPLGADWPPTRDALARGDGAVAPVTSWDTTGFPSTVAAAIDRTWPDEDRRRPLALAAALAGELGAKGPVETVCLACASGATSWTTRR